MNIFIKFCILFFVSPSFVFAQSPEGCNCKTPPKHRFLVQTTGLKSLNKNKSPDITHVDLGQSKVATHPHFLTANNTVGYQIGIGYEYTNRRRYTWSANILYGVLQHDYEWNFTFDDFDTAANFGTYSEQHVYNNTIPYVAISLMTGRDYVPLKSKKIKIQCKVGLSYMDYLKQDDKELVYFISYGEFPQYFRIKQFAWTYVNTGNADFYYTFYLGASYATGSKILKEYRFGISFTHAWSFFGRDGDEIGGPGGLYYNADGQMIGGETFHNRFRNVGITLAAGF